MDELNFKKIVIIIKKTLKEYLLCAKPHSKCFIWFHPYNTLGSVGSLVILFIDEDAEAQMG